MLGSSPTFQGTCLQFSWWKTAPKISEVAFSQLLNLSSFIHKFVCNALKLPVRYLGFYDCSLGFSFSPVLCALAGVLEVVVLFVFQMYVCDKLFQVQWLQIFTVYYSTCLYIYIFFFPCKWLARLALCKYKHTFVPIFISKLKYEYDRDNSSCLSVSLVVVYFSGWLLWVQTFSAILSLCLLWGCAKLKHGAHSKKNLPTCE